MTPANCPIQVTLHGYWIDCTFPAGHEPWLHSWQTPGESPFVMAPTASEVRNRDGGPLGFPYDAPGDEAAIRAGERERCAELILAHVKTLDHPHLTAEGKTHLDGLRVAAMFLRDGMQGVRDWEPQP